MVTTTKMRAIRIGDLLTVFPVKPGRVFKVWPAGTYDVILADGRCFRLTGLFGARVPE